MFLKTKYKLIKKCSFDFWGISYFRPRPTKFFIYLKKLFIFKVKQSRYNRKKRKLLLPKAFLKNESFIKSKKANLALKERNRKLDNVNYYLLFGRMHLAKAMYVYGKASRVKISKEDLIMGISINKYKRKRESHSSLYKKKKIFERNKLYLKRIIYSYNQLNLKKLRKLGYLASKSKMGTINKFFYLLEGRLDSILVRFNLGSRFYVKKFIQAKNVLINDKCISSINYIVTDLCYISFIKKKKRYIYELLRNRVTKKLFLAQPPYYFEINYRILTFLIIPKLLHPYYIPFPFRKVKSTLINGLHTVLWGW